MFNRSGSRLPQELIDNIIDYSRGSVRDLKSLSLIGRPWLLRSRKHLFHSLRLNGTYRSNIVAEAISSLQAVLPLVQHLTLNSSIPSKPLQLSDAALTSIGQSFPNLLRLTLSGVFIEEGKAGDIPMPKASLRNLTLENVMFVDVLGMLRSLSNPLYSHLHSLSVDDITFFRNNHRSLSYHKVSFQQPAQIQEMVLGSVKAPVLKALWGSSSPLDVCSSLARVSLCNRGTFDCADIALGQRKLWSNVTHLTCSLAWRSAWFFVPLGSLALRLFLLVNVKLFPANITHLTMTYKTLARLGAESRLSHLISTSRKLESLVLVFYWPQRTDSERLNTIMSDFDEDLAAIAGALPVEIYLRFVLKSEHSADFALMERLHAMFLRLDDALCLRKEEIDEEGTTPLSIEVKEISDQEYRPDLRLGLGFEY
ncbi:hypothetical protein V5O48_006783 [Marasmius crinis-equi]|uniref:F-box domain-containing protein n=1 Tax=Marasmius crinis-equi TaxID=585013 RepID=A0ABR3FIX3_9AGAR